MSMILMLERISSGTALSNSQQAVVVEKQQTAISLRIFNGEDTDAVSDDGSFYIDEDEEGAGDCICLEKAWHGLHFLLTGEPWGGAGWRAFLLCGGGEQGGDMGYGPMRRFEPEEVSSINEVLADISDDDLWSQFDAEQMIEDEIYPDIWDEPEEDLREEYLHYFQILKEFVTRTAESHDALQLYLT